MGQLTNVTYIFGNMEADNVEHLSTILGQLTNVIYNFRNMEADNVERLFNHGLAHNCYL
jgi:hypothetical protein